MNSPGINNETLARSIPFDQIYLKYPILEPLYFSYEKKFDPWYLQHQMVNMNYITPIVAVIIYLLFCHYGTKYMKDKEPYNLLQLLTIWNFTISLFSFYGMTRTVPHLLYRIMNYSIEDTVCEPAWLAYGHGTCGFATYLFIWSKFPELIDTIFIILRKKSLLFLHWYHHITVLLYCWNAYVTESSAGLYFIAMNYSVHTIMYFYYGLQSLRIIPKWFPSWIITLLQILQMVIGTIIVILSLYYYFYGYGKYLPGKCNNKVSNLIVGGVIYTSYLYLFIDFALKRYIFNKNKINKIINSNKYSYNNINNNDNNNTIAKASGIDSGLLKFRSSKVTDISHIDV